MRREIFSFLEDTPDTNHTVDKYNHDYQDIFSSGVKIFKEDVMNKSEKTVTVARAIIRIGDAARNANNYSLLGALYEIVEQLSQNGLKILTSIWICC